MKHGEWLNNKHSYRGAAAGDTPENTGIRSKIERRSKSITMNTNRRFSAYGDTLGAGKGIKLYIDWHSYGQYILTYVISLMNSITRTH